MKFSVYLGVAGIGIFVGGLIVALLGSDNLVGVRAMYAGAALHIVGYAMYRLHNRKR